MGVKWVGGQVGGWSSGWGSSGCVAQVCVYVVKVCGQCVCGLSVFKGQVCSGVKWVGGQVGGWSKWVAIHLTLTGSVHRFRIYKFFLSTLNISGDMNF